MLQKLFTVHDIKASAYLPPIACRTSGEAMRSFESECRNENSQFNKFPADFTLYEIGTWDQLTSEIKMLEKPHPLVSASEYVKQ